MKTKTFLLKDIVNIDYGNKYDLQKMTFDRPEINFVSRTASNNGVVAKVDRTNKAPYEPGCLTIALGGSIGSTFYQNNPFYTGQNVAVIKFKEDISKYSKLYLCQIIKFEVKNKFRAFGRELNKHIRTDFTVDLPINELGKPDWLSMKNFIQTLHSKQIKTSNKNTETNTLNSENWEEFKIGQLFNLINGIKYPSYDREFGTLPLVSTTAYNNGISDYIDDRDEKYNNILTVAYSGSVGATFYQNKDVFVGETVFALIPKFNMNKYIAMFLCTILNYHNYKYTYGRKIIGTRYVDDIIKLPTLNGQPDWQYMENYIKSLQFADRI